MGLATGHCVVCGSVTFNVVDGEHLCAWCVSWSAGVGHE